VIDVKKGNPISLALLYVEIASRLRIPIYGVNLPEHFVLAYTRLPIQYLDNVSKEDVLFYINTFNKGSLFEEKEIQTFLKQIQEPIKEQYFVPCDAVTMITRIINNLKFTYSKTGYCEKVDELEELLSCLED